MRKLVVSASLVAGLAATAALAQPAATMAPQGMPYGANAVTGAWSGNNAGTGMSMPMGSHAGSINQQDTAAVIAPNFASPDVGDNAPVNAYLRAAQGALAAGRTGEAQQALEMAQTRLLDRSVPLGQTNQPSNNPGVRQISQALQALAAGDRAGCLALIQSAIGMTNAGRP